MEWAATERAVVVKLAVPELRVVELRVEAPSLKMTVPEGVPEPGEVGITVAVKVTDWPKTDGLVEEVSVVVLSDLLTTWDKAGELVLVLKLVSPLYTAVSEWLVTERALEV